MGKFDASAVEDLDYDFTKWGAGKGTIPEPSQKAMKRYQSSLGKLQLDVARATGDLEDAKMKDITDEDLSKLEAAAETASDTLDTELGKLCQNSPGKDDFEKLPFRVKQAFIKWLMKELSPEGGASATKS